MTSDAPASTFDFDSLSLDWLRAKPGVKWSKPGARFNAWVADMDFPPAPGVRDALLSLAERGDAGYPNWRHVGGGSPATEAWADWCARRYGWRVDPGDTRELCNVLQGVEVVLHHCTAPGDRVVLHVPAYHPFLTVLGDMGRQVVPVPAVADGDASAGWRYDYDALDVALTREPARVLLLCHPQNPTGHVFDEAELRELAALAERHDLLIVSDEIHADLVYAPQVHHPMAMFAPDRTVTLQAVSKTFNLAGLRHAILHTTVAAVRDAMATAPAHLYGATNLAGSLAAEAAWRTGERWVDALLDHLDRQRHLLGVLLAEHLPGVVYTPPHATYLAWLDCTALGWGDNPATVFADRGVRLNEGPTFGAEGRGFARLNFATSADVLRLTVEAMATSAT